MKTFFASYKIHFLIMLVLLVAMATQSAANIFNGFIVMLSFTVITLSLLGFIRLGVYRQLLIFLTLLQIFTFAIKVSYGVVSSTILALLPTAYLAAMLICVSLLGVHGKLRFRFSLQDILVLSFFVLDFVQVFNTYLRYVDNQDAFIIGLRGFQQRSFFGFVYFVIRWLNISSFRFNTIVRILAYTASLGGLYALIQQLFGFDSLETAHRLAQISKDPLLEAQYIARAEGFLGSPFTFGLISATGLVSGIYLFNCVLLSKLERLFSIASVLLNGLAVVLSGSRSTYFSLIVMCIILVFLMRMPLFSLARRSFCIIFALMMSLSFLIITFPDSTPVQYSMERISSLTEVFSDGNSIEDMNFIIRRELIAASGPMILSNPFGYGTGIFNGGSNPDGVVTVNGYSTFMDNEYVGLALELGILGVLFFLAIVGVALHRCHLALRLPAYRDRARVLAALVVICPIAGIGGQWLAAYPVNIIFWLVLGLSAGLPVSVRSLQYSVNHG